MNQKILIVFATVALYGMERSVIETFDLLRLLISPHFLMPYTTSRLALPVLDEVRRRNLEYSFFSDWHGWPRFERPRSVRHLCQLLGMLVRSNLDVFKAAWGKDVIYLPGYRYAYLSFLAIIFYRLRGKRVIYRFHDLINRYSLPLRLTSLLVTDFVHNTEFSYREMLANNPYLGRKKNHIITYPIETRPKIDEVEDRQLAAAFAGYKNILFVGQVAEHKGVGLLLQAMERIAETHENVSLHILGACSDPALVQKLQASRFANGCKLTLWGYRKDTFSFLRKSDIYVHPSLPSQFHESFGRGVVEAMMTGVPSICFKSGALQEIVVHERTGLICEEETAKCLAMNLCRLLDDAKSRKSYGVAARARYEEKYAAPQFMTGWLNLLALG